MSIDAISLVDKSVMLSRTEELRLGRLMVLGRAAQERLARKPALNQRWRLRLEEVVTIGDDARSSLIMSCYRLAIKLTASIIPRVESKEDYMQEALKGLIAAVDRYDPERGRLTTYAYRSIVNTIRHHLKYDRRLHKRQQFICNAERDCLGYVEDSTLDEADQRQHESRVVRESLAALPDRDREVLRDRIESGLTLQGCALKHGISKQAIHQAQVRAMDHLRSLVEYAGIREGA